MAFITYPIPGGTKLAVLSITGGDLAVSALALSDGTPVDGTHPIPVSVSAFPATQAVTQSGSWSVGITGTLPAFAATPTVNLGTIGAAATDASVTETHTTLGANKVVRVLSVDANGNPLGIGGASAAYTVQDTTLDGVVGNLGSAWGASHPSVIVGVQTSGGAIGGLTLGAHGGLVVEGVASGTVIPVAYASTPTVNAAQSGTWTVAQGSAGSTAWKVDGSGATQPVSGTVAVSNSFALDATLTNGSQKTQITDASNVASGLIEGWLSFNNGGSALPAAGVQVKGSAGVISAFIATNGTTATGYLQIHNSATVGGISTSTIVWPGSTQTTNGSTIAQTLPTGGIRCASGIVLAWSSTQFTYTAVATNTGGINAYYR